MSLKRLVRGPNNILSSLQYIYSWGRSNKIHQITLLMQTYEKPTIKRNRITQERSYAAKKHYLKYAAEAIKYASKQ